MGGSVEIGTEAQSLIVRAEAEGRHIYRQGKGIHVESYPDVTAAARRIHGAISSAAARRGRRFHREVMVAGAPRWLGDLAWAFPTWRVCKRPFDWAHDDADLPATPPEPVPYPEQARLRLYLRPSTPAVQ